MEEEEKVQKSEGASKASSKPLVFSLLFVGGVVLVLGYVLLANKKSTTPTSVENQQIPTVAESAKTGGAVVKEVSVTASDFSFTPKSISVNQDEKIKLTFVNNGKNPHNFVINELGVATKTIPGGGTDTVEFTAQNSGTFNFYCAVGNHRALGMEGDLEVK